MQSGPNDGHNIAGWLLFRVPISGLPVYNIFLRCIVFKYYTELQNENVSQTYICKINFHNISTYVIYFVVKIILWFA